MTLEAAADFTKVSRPGRSGVILAVPCLSGRLSRHIELAGIVHSPHHRTFPESGTESHFGNGRMEDNPLESLDALEADLDDSSSDLRDLITDKSRLPVLPLRDTVVYPGVAVPISAGRPGTIEAVQDALDGDRRLFAVAQRENVDEPTPDILYNVGTIVRIIQTHRVRGAFSSWYRVSHGRRPSNTSGTESPCSWLARWRWSASSANPTDPAFQALDRELRDRAAELGTRRGVPAEALNQLIQGVEEPGAFSDLVAFYLELPSEDKQRLLETLDDEVRMRSALVLVERELARLDAQEEIQARVQEELGERQREMLLREQMKADPEGAGR